MYVHINLAGGILVLAFVHFSSKYPLRLPQAEYMTNNTYISSLLTLCTIFTCEGID